jgi:hypothetical protein
MDDGLVGGFSTSALRSAFSFGKKREIEAQNLLIKNGLRQSLTVTNDKGIETEKRKELL